MRSSWAAKNGSRGNAPCRVKGQRPLWGLGQRPNCFSGAQFKETAHKGAGSEASLPVTLRFLRSAPKLLFRLLMLCRARWARPNGWSFKHSCFFLKAGNFASAEATKGHENRRSLRSPFGNLRCAPMFIELYRKLLVSVLFIFLSNGFAQAA